MKKRVYYSVRTGKNPQALELDLSILLRLFGTLYQSFVNKGYFQEAFGYWCTDVGGVSGALGDDIEVCMLRLLRKSNLWPIEKNLVNYKEDDLFDIIEFLYDHVSKPIERESYYHRDDSEWSYDRKNDCGWHHNKFDQQAGRQELREELNNLLSEYQSGYELSDEGEILALAESGLETLLQAPIPEYDRDNVTGRVEAAKLKFRRYRSSMDDRRDAIRDLADVLEFLRPKVKAVLNSKDESDLFSIANNFAIRHHNDRQQTNYDKDVWYSWMFYFFLSTIHATLRLIEREEQNS